MVRYARGRGLLRWGEAWFGETVDGEDVDILEHIQADDPPGGLHCEPFPSLRIDLDPPGEDILAGFDKTTRYEVRRALGKDGVQTTWLPEVGEEDLRRFLADYDRFARSRQLPPASERRLEAMRAAGALVLSRASLEGVVHVWHAYICVNDCIRLLLSCTADRSLGPELRAQIGRSNRALHYGDALAAKQSRVRWLDLGGVSGHAEGPLRSVDAFKESFGGRRVVGWNALEARSARGRAALAATKVRTRLRQARRDGERTPAG